MSNEPSDPKQENLLLPIQHPLLIAGDFLLGQRFVPACARGMAEAVLLCRSLGTAFFRAENVCAGFLFYTLLYSTLLFSTLLFSTLCTFDVIFAIIDVIYFIFDVKNKVLQDKIIG
jgi:hypothetical protein